MLHRPFRSLALLLATAGTLVAQAPAPKAPLLPPAGLTYRYWPLSITQFIGAELPYTAISLYMDDRSGHPLYDVTLTSREGNKRVHYVNSPDLLTEDKALGEDAFPAQIVFERSGDIAKGAQYTTRFNNEKGVPITWQFVQLTDVSDQGSGLTPLKTPAPYLLFREGGALAGEGTALKVGNVTSNATVWKELAAPPYFVPYQGALSQGVHILSLRASDTRWTDSEPAAPADGASWQLSSGEGSTLSAHLLAGKNTSVVSFTSAVLKTSMTVEAQPAANGWSITRVSLGPEASKPEHTLHFDFTPALTSSSESHFDLVAGKKTKLASGGVKSTGAGNSETLQWTLAAPDWAKGETATANAAAQ